MSEPKRSHSAPLDLPDRTDQLEPTPVEGCAGCAELARARDTARAGRDLTTVTDCNVLMARHPDGH
ncbi:hypothetical protein OOK29_48080 [Streptomyces phaeochromogenes]|uniref:hypothetical protein n=1 Tax=Streptomyces phaeochromogenes TaxID=1923 RepID=UPI002258A027|nr:hypothetical protein [Streptomyces phaeochromogenes]MCX5605887.1 hypothetical protein [Streptomyces phaeochromogenes]